MVRGICGKSFLAAMVAVAAMGASSVAKAASISFSSNNIQVTSSTNFSAPYTGTVTFGTNSASTFSATISDQLANSPFNYSIDGTGNGVVGKISSFSATVPVTNNVIGAGGSFSLTLTDLIGGQIGTVSGTLASGGAFNPGPPGGFTGIALTSLVFSNPDIGGMIIPGFFNASPITSGAFVGSTQLLISMNGDGTAHFTIDATISGDSRPTPLPAAVWSGMGMMSAMGGIGAFIRRRRR
jgi:hypothetical protein